VLPPKDAEPASCEPLLESQLNVAWPLLVFLSAGSDADVERKRVVGQRTVWWDSCDPGNRTGMSVAIALARLTCSPAGSAILLPASDYTCGLSGRALHL